MAVKNKNWTIYSFQITAIIRFCVHIASATSCVQVSSFLFISYGGHKCDYFLGSLSLFLIVSIHFCLHSQCHKSKISNHSSKNNLNIKCIGQKWPRTTRGLTFDCKCRWVSNTGMHEDKSTF